MRLMHLLAPSDVDSAKLSWQPAILGPALKKLCGISGFAVITVKNRNAHAASSFDGCTHMAVHPAIILSFCCDGRIIRISGIPASLQGLQKSSQTFRDFGVTCVAWMQTIRHIFLLNHWDTRLYTTGAEQIQNRNTIEAGD